MHLSDTWMKRKKKNDLTKTFIKLGNQPESINSDDNNALEFLVKKFYFRNVNDIKNIVCVCVCVCVWRYYKQQSVW